MSAGLCESAGVSESVCVGLGAGMWLLCGGGDELGSGLGLGLGSGLGVGLVLGSVAGVDVGMSSIVFAVSLSTFTIHS